MSLGWIESDSLERVSALESEELVRRCARTPEIFYAVGAWYEAFPQTSDEEVSRLLEWAWDSGRG